jgi:hypothetical protein
MQRRELETWLSLLGRAWEQGDAELAASLFDPQVSYQENPFDPPLHGAEAVRRYWRESLASQLEVKFSGHVLAVEGDTGVVNWKVEFVRIGSGERVQLDGVSLGRFGPAGKPVLWREWWHKRGEEAKPQP